MGGSTSVPSSVAIMTTTTVPTSTVIPTLSDTNLHRIGVVDPIYQLGTPWLPTASVLAIDVIFWISCLKFVVCFLTGLIIRFCGSTTKSYHESQGYEQGTQAYTHTYTETLNGHSTTTASHGMPWSSLVLSGIVIPLLGICSIMFDSKEMLKAYCIIIIIGLIYGIWIGNMQGRYRGCCGKGCGNVRVALCFIFLALGFCLQLVTIAFACPYAFKKEVATEI